MLKMDKFVRWFVFLHMIQPPLPPRPPAEKQRQSQKATVPMVFTALTHTSSSFSTPPIPLCHNHLLQILNNSISILMRLRLSTKITRDRLALRQRLEDSRLDLIRVLVQTHVLQHHDRRKEKCCGVGKTLARNIRRGTVHGFKDRALVSNIP